MSAQEISPIVETKSDISLHVESDMPEVQSESAPRLTTITPESRLERLNRIAHVILSGPQTD